jgi:hypothetical protein
MAAVGVGMVIRLLVCVGVGLARGVRLEITGVFAAAWVFPLLPGGFVIMLHPETNKVQNKSKPVILNLCI